MNANEDPRGAIIIAPYHVGAPVAVRAALEGNPIEEHPIRGTKLILYVIDDEMSGTDAKDVFQNTYLTELMERTSSWLDEDPATKEKKLADYSAALERVICEHTSM